MNPTDPDRQPFAASSSFRDEPPTPSTFTPSRAPQTDWARATWGREPGMSGTPERWFEPTAPRTGGDAAAPTDTPTASPVIGSVADEAVAFFDRTL